MSGISNSRDFLDVDILHTSFDAFMAMRRKEAADLATNFSFPTSRTLANAQEALKSDRQTKSNRKQQPQPYEQRSNTLPTVSRQNHEQTVPQVTEDAPRRNPAQSQTQRAAQAETSVISPPMKQTPVSSRGPSVTVSVQTRALLKAALQGYRVRYILRSAYGKSLRKQLDDVQQEINQLSINKMEDSDEWIRKLRQERAVHVEALTNLIETAPLKPVKSVLIVIIMH